MHVLLCFRQFFLGVYGQSAANQIIIKNEDRTDNDEDKGTEIYSYFRPNFHEVGMLAVVDKDMWPQLLIVDEK